MRLCLKVILSFLLVASAAKAGPIQPGAMQVIDGDTISDYALFKPPQGLASLGHIAYIEPSSVNAPGIGD
jgi:hypothetical protein